MKRREDREDRDGWDAALVRSAGLAVLALGIYIAAVAWLDHRQPAQAEVRQAVPDRERLPVELESKGRQLAFFGFEEGDPADPSTHLAATGFNSRQSLKLTPSSPFSPGLWIPFRDLGNTDSAWIRLTAYVWFSGSSDSAFCSLVATCNQGGTNYKYLSIPLEKERLKPFTWNPVQIDYRIPPPAGPGDIVQAYLWYRGGTEMLADDIVVTRYGP